MGERGETGRGKHARRGGASEVVVAACQKTATTGHERGKQNDSRFGKD